MTEKYDFITGVKRYGAELVIVFVGVYAAFWVDNYREQQTRHERTDQIIATLRVDLEDYVQVGIRYNEAITTGIEDWRALRQAGHRPPPFVLRIHGSEEPPVTVWQAISNSSLIDLLEPNLLFDLGFYYSEMAGVGRKYVRYAEFTDARVLPGLKDGEDWFYDESGVLKPEFSAHMDRLTEYRDDTAAMMEWAECLIDRLDAVNRQTEQCRGSVGRLRQPTGEGTPNVE